MSHYDLETKCLHSGYTPKKGEPCALPIYQSTTFKYDTTDEMGQLFDLKAEGYFYTRLQNPTNDAVAAKIADLEGGVAGLLTSSGQAANFYAIFNICEAGDHVSRFSPPPFFCFDGCCALRRRIQSSGCLRRSGKDRVR